MFNSNVSLKTDAIIKSCLNWFKLQTSYAFWHSKLDIKEISLNFRNYSKVNFKYFPRKIIKFKDFSKLNYRSVTDEAWSLWDIKKIVWATNSASDSSLKGLWKSGGLFEEFQNNFARQLTRFERTYKSKSWFQNFARDATLTSATGRTLRFIRNTYITLAGYYEPTLFTFRVAG